MAITPPSTQAASASSGECRLRATTAGLTKMPTPTTPPTTRITALGKPMATRRPSEFTVASDMAERNTA